MGLSANPLSMVLLVTLIFFVPTTILADDGAVLVDFMKLADPSESSTLWKSYVGQQNSSNVDYCQYWNGEVKCDDNRRIIELYVENIVGFNGTLSHDIFIRLNELRVLSLRQNQLQGSLPDDFSAAPHLHTLYLDNNQFSGSISTSLGLLPNLQKVYLSNNKFTGSLPDSPNFSSLVSFDVSNNNFSGPIPRSLAHFDVLSFQGNPNLCGQPLQRACPHSSKGGLNKTIYIIVGVVGIAIIFFVGFLWFKKNRKGQEKTPKNSPHSDQGCRKSDFTTMDIKLMRRSNAGGLGKDLSLVCTSKDELLTHEVSLESVEEKGNLECLDVEDRRFELEDLLKANAQILGRGIMGISYKAALEEGMHMVVKRLSVKIQCNKADFLKIMASIKTLTHSNILPLRAHFYSKEEKLLIYDYAPNGSLFYALHSPEGRRNTPLDWMSRIKIAKGVASALDHIHTTYSAYSTQSPSLSPACKVQQRYLGLHGNLKSSNIVLGAHMHPYVADYGVASILANTVAQAYMAGYRAPECRGGTSRKLTVSVDVYSYGVLLLELLTGKMPMMHGSMKGGQGVDLPIWVESVVREEWTAEVFDRELNCSKVEEDELVALLRLAMACVSPKLEQRPSMAVVLQALSEDIKPFDQDDALSNVDTNDHYTASPNCSTFSPGIDSPNSSTTHHARDNSSQVSPPNPHGLNSPYSSTHQYNSSHLSPLDPHPTHVHHAHHESFSKPHQNHLHQFAHQESFDTSHNASSYQGHHDSYGHIINRHPSPRQSSFNDGSSLHSNGDVEMSSKDQFSFSFQGQFSNANTMETFHR